MLSGNSGQLIPSQRVEPKSRACLIPPSNPIKAAEASEQSQRDNEDGLPESCTINSIPFHYTNKTPYTSFCPLYNFCLGLAVSKTLPLLSKLPCHRSNVILLCEPTPLSIRKPTLVFFFVHRIYNVCCLQSLATSQIAVKQLQINKQAPSIQSGPP